MKINLTRSFALFFVLLFCLACQDKKEQTTTISRHTDSIHALKLAIPTTLGNMPYFYADFQGLYQKYGLNVRLSVCHSASHSGMLMILDSVDFCSIDHVQKQYLQKERNIALKTFFTTETLWSTITKPKSRLTKPQQLTYKTIGTTRHTFADSVLQHILTQTHTDPLKISFVQLDNPWVVVEMLEQQQIDAANLPAPYLSLLQSNRKCNVLYPPQKSIEWLCCKSNQTDSLSTTAQTLHKIIVEANDSLKNITPSKWQQLLHRYYNLSTKDANKISSKTFSQP